MLGFDGLGMEVVRGVALEVSGVTFLRLGEWLLGCVLEVKLTVK